MINRYYRFLNLPFDLKFDIPVFAKANHQRIDTIPQPLIEFLKDHECQVSIAEVFKKDPGYHSHRGIHLDGLDFDDHVKINFVIDNFDSIMCWWQAKEPKYLNNEVTVIGTNFIWAEAQHCDLLASVSIDRPALVNVGQLHSIESVTVNTRYAFTFMIMKNNGQRLLWDEALVKFKDLIIKE